MQRKGARSIAEIPAEILAELNQGKLETANLVEWLAVDHRVLLANVLEEWKRSHWLEPILFQVDSLPKQTVNTVNEAIGKGLYGQILDHRDFAMRTKLSQHGSDFVRCWAALVESQEFHGSMQELLGRIQPFATDSHFGVREIAWLAIRHHIIRHLDQSIAELAGWARSEDASLRRFASEATRPRGVWCAHIEVLKKNPSLALPILEPLHSDPAKYVQDSVANWLNDASKTQPDFVREICAKWASQSDTKATAYIVKRALRTLEKGK